MTDRPLPVPVARQADRRLDQAWLGGVCAGLAAHLGWPVIVLRLGVILLAASRLLGVVIYLLLWLAMPLAAEAREAPGLEAARRSGLRTKTGPGHLPADVGLVSAAALIGGGLLWLVQTNGWGLRDEAFWPAAWAAVGLGVLWWQADHSSSRAIRSASGFRRWVVPLVAHWTGIVRILGGLVALGVAVGLTATAQSGIGELYRLLLVLGLSVAALALAVAPWLLRVRRSLAAAREQRMIADARADMAAHLHDSVLQTLALIQRQAGDPKAVATLARRQERELRAWLYGEEPDETTLKAALVSAAADVEDVHGVPVELVTVGDCPLEGELAALVRAAREAMVNAAKHSGADKVDVYAEVEEDRVEVFVRDRGKGFDPAAVGPDRMGVRGSIVERLRRAGGNATIRSAPAEGTEVKLEMHR